MSYILPNLDDTASVIHSIEANTAEFQAARHRRHTPEQQGIEKSPSAPR